MPLKVLKALKAPGEYLKYMVDYRPRTDHGNALLAGEVFGNDHLALFPFFFVFFAILEACITSS